jgi:hypothetical protein
MPVEPKSWYNDAQAFMTQAERRAWMAKQVETADYYRAWSRGGPEGAAEIRRIERNRQIKALNQQLAALQAEQDAIYAPSRPAGYTS